MPHIHEHVCHGVEEHGFASSQHYMFPPATPRCWDIGWGDAEGVRAKNSSKTIIQPLLWSCSHWHNALETIRHHTAVCFRTLNPEP